MPCRFPEHHSGGPSAAQPVALLIVIALVATIVEHWRTLVIAIVTTTCLLVAVGLAVWLYRNKGSGIDPELERLAALERAQTACAAVDSGMASHAPAIAPAAPTAALEAAPVVHQHLHLHGLTAAEIAGVLERSDGSWTSGA